MIETGTSLSRQLWQPIRMRWKFVLGVTLLAVVLTLVAQAVIPPKYTASVVLGPSDQAESPLSGLSKLSGLASVAGVSLNDKGTVSEFDKFQFLVMSDRLGVYQAHEPGFLAMVFDQRWDPATRRWRKPDGLVQSFKDIFNPIFGLPAWLPPDGRDLAELYDQNLAIKKVGETNLIQLNYRDTRPERAGKVLAAIVRDTDLLLRRDAELRARQQATYLRTQMALAQVLEYRQNLAGLLARQEQTLMLTASSQPFSAETLQAPTLSKTATTQRPYLFAAIAAVIGFSVGAFIAIMLGIPAARAGEPDGAAIPDAL